MANTGDANKRIEIPLYGIEQEIVEEQNRNTQFYEEKRAFSEQANFNFNKQVEELFVSIRTDFNADLNYEAEDYKAFLKETMKEFLYKQMTGFFNAQAKKKMAALKPQYDTISQLYTERFQALHEEIDGLQAQFRTLKEREEAAVQVIGNIAKVFREKIHLQNQIVATWKREAAASAKADRDARKAFVHYQKYLLKRVLRFWKGWAYKNQLNKKWKLKHSIHVEEIKNEYMSIIDNLKLKIGDIEKLIQVRRKGRMEFSFAMSKNLLKNISNLSMEVMNLNQTTFKGDISEYEKTKQMMSKTNTFIHKKLSEIDSIRLKVD